MESSKQKVKVKHFSRATSALWAALLPRSVAISQTPAYTV